MSPKFLYLLLDLGSFTIPFLFSFYSKANFSKQWKFVLPGIFITACVFIVWDELFTRAGVWGFNEKYTTGIFINSLPIEELLFFICIPYACYFTYFAMKFFIRADWMDRHEKKITIALAIAMVCLSVAFVGKLYSFVTFLSLGVLLSFRLWQGMTKNISRFYLSYLILLIPFFIVNGILTGSGIEQPVVWYNNAETVGIRISTIPLEDFFYAMLMILLSITIAEKLELSKKKE